MYVPYRPLTLAQLKENAKAQPIEYLVDQLLPIGTLNQIVGKPKAGKSTIARQLAVAVTKGHKFLDRITVKAEVLYFAPEELGAHLDEHFTMLGADDGVHTVLGSPGKAFAQSLEETLKLMPEVRLVIIDPLIQFISVKDSDKYTEMSVALAELSTLAAKHKLVILAVHHQKKRATEEAGDSVLGSSAIFGTVSTSVFLKGELGKVRIIQSAQRYGVRLDEAELEFDDSTRSYSLGQRTSSVQERRVNNTRQARANKILKTIGEHPQGIEQEELRQLVGCSAGDLIAELAALSDAGEIQREGAGRKGSPYRYLSTGEHTAAA